MGETFAGAIIFVWLLALVLAIVWTILPFAIFGTKPLLRQLLAEQKETNRLLRAIGTDARERQAGAPDVRL